MKADKNKEWRENKLKENKMLREAIDKKWTKRIVNAGLIDCKTDFIFKELITSYSDDYTYITNVGYLVKIKPINREYIGQLIKKYKRKELETDE